MKRLLLSFALLLGATSLRAQCTNLPVGQTCVPVATLRITGSYADHIDIKPGASLNLGFVALDAAGKNITHHVVKWYVGDSSIIKITTGGKLTGVKYGTTRVGLDVGEQSVSLPVLVSPYSAPNCTASTTTCAQVAILQELPPNALADTTDHVDARAGYAYSMGLIAKDPTGNNISAHTVQWWTSDSTVLSTTLGGRITGKKVGNVDLWLKVGIAMTKLPACVVNSDIVPLLLSTNYVEASIPDSLQADTVGVLPDTMLMMLHPIVLHAEAAWQLFAHEGVTSGYRRRMDPCVHWTSTHPYVTVDRHGLAKFRVTDPYADLETAFHFNGNLGVKAALGRVLP